MITGYKGISPQIAKSAFVAPGTHIIGDVHVGEHSSVWFNCVLRGDCYYIRIGESTNIQDGTVIHVTNGRFATIIGDHVTVGHSVVLHGCTVKDRSLIGIGAIVLDDVIIGEESFIGAGSLITPGSVIPPRSMVMGAPAKVRRQVTEEEVARIDEHWQHYVEYKNSYIADRGLRIADSTPSSAEEKPVEGRQESAFNFELPSEGISLEEVEKSLITQAMERTNWNITRAAKLLGLSFRTLQYRLEKFGMNKADEE